MSNELMLPPPTHPGKVAKALLKLHRHEGKPTRLYIGGSWWTWVGTHWDVLDPKEHWSDLTKILNRAVVKDGTSWNPDTRNTNHVLRQMEGLGFAKADTMRLDGRQLVACQNGLLDVRTRELLPHDPGYFNQFAVPFDYDPDAGEPVEFEKFLRSLWPDDPEAVRMLWQWFGYVLSGRTDLQKILMIVGPPRSGKGTILRVLAELIGYQNLTTMTFEKFSQNFGMQSMIGKVLAALTDAHASKGKTDSAVEYMKGISGEDPQTIGRKYATDWEGILPTRLMVMANQIPVLHDSSGAMASRFIILRMTNSFIGKEDIGLLVRLKKELPAILNKSLAAMEELQRRGGFREPASSINHRKALEAAVSPVKEWAEHYEKCIVGPAVWIEKSELLNAYNDWRAEQEKPGRVSQSQFGRDLVSLYSGVTPRERSVGGKRIYVYDGIILTPTFI